MKQTSGGMPLGLSISFKSIPAFGENVSRKLLDCQMSGGMMGWST
jgi:hypothetical protein